MSINQNLELKHHCDDFSRLRKALVKLGAKKEIVKKQKDLFFNLPTEKKKQKGRMKLRIETERIFVIYYERPSFVADEYTVSDYVILEADETVLDFLTASLGVMAIVEKTREVWRKDNTVFHLDTVKGVGKIFEIELQKKGKLIDSDRKLFAVYQELVSPFLGKVIKGSNVDLIVKSNLKK